MVQKKTTTQLKSLNNENKTTGKQTSKPNQPQRTANTKRPVKLNKNLTQRQVRSFKTVKPEKRVRRKYPFKICFFTHNISRNSHSNERDSWIFISCQKFKHNGRKAL